MLFQQRQKWILQQLQAGGAVTAAQIVKQLQVSPETVRRDLLAMERQGLLRRVHGGAVAEGGMKPYYDLDRRNLDHNEEKRSLARNGVSLLCPGEVIGVDCGSTAMFFAEALKQCAFPLTVVTHSTDVFQRLKEHPQIEVILCGGHYKQQEKAFYGELTLAALDRLYMQRVFLFPSAVSLEHGICDYQQELLQVQQRYLTRADKVYILADSSKFEKKALLKLADMRQEFVYVTDSGLPASLKELYAENNRTVITEVQQAYDPYRE